MAKILSIEAFLEAADPENYADPPDPPEGHLVADRYLRLMVMQRRLAAGRRPYSPKDLDPAKVKGGTSAGLTGNGRTAWHGAAGYDWFTDQPWWDDHLEWVMQKQVSEREAGAFPLFFPGYSVTDFYSLSGELQEREIDHAEAVEQARIQARRLELGRFIAQAKRLMLAGDRRWNDHFQRMIELATRDLEHLRPPEWKAAEGKSQGRKRKGATSNPSGEKRKKKPIGTGTLFTESTP